MNEDLIDQLIQAWEINNRIDLYLLEAIKEDRLTLKSPKCRSIGEQFSHMHNVRISWMQVGGPPSTKNFKKIEKDDVHDKAVLKKRIKESGEFVSEFLRAAYETGGKTKAFKPSAAALQNYLVAHDSHHRGLIINTLKQEGSPLPEEITDGIWEWDRR